MNRTTTSFKLCLPIGTRLYCRLTNAGKVVLELVLQQMDAFDMPNPYLPPRGNPRWTSKPDVSLAGRPRTALLLLASLTSGALVGIVVLAATAFGVAFALRGTVVPDTFPLILTLLLLANLTCGVFWGGYVAWLRVAKGLRTAPGSVAHAAAIAFSVTSTVCYVACRPNQFQEIDGLHLQSCLLISTGIIYVFSALVARFRCRPVERAAQ